MDTEKNILESAKGLFMQYGLKSITMDDIASKAGVSKKTIYLFFTDKSSIVKSAVESHFAEYQLMIKESIAKSTNALEAIFSMSHCMKSQMENSNPTVLYDLKRYFPKAFKEFLRYKDGFMRGEFVDILQSGVDSGYFRKEIDIEVLVISRIEQVQAGFKNEVFPRTKYDFRHVQSQLFDHFVHGLLTDKGRIIYNQYLNEAKDA